jgi:hypothetical protein
MAVQLLAPSIEVGLVTTNRDAMTGFYEGFLGLSHQADLDFPGGSMKRYAVGANVVLKLVGYDEPPTSATPPSRPPTPGTRWSKNPPPSLRCPAWGGASWPTRTATGSNWWGRSKRICPTLFRRP